ncbi:MAG: CBS domain-containing protein [Myxococcota bacterium]
MKATQFMTREVRCILPETSAAEAWRLMHELGAKHLPVVREGKLVGVLSDRDFLGFCTRSRDGSLVFSDVAAGQVMSVDPVVGLEGASVAELARTMLTHHIDSLPIVGEGRTLVGLVTSTDLLTLLLESREELPMTFRIRPQVSA